MIKQRQEEIEGMLEGCDPMRATAAISADL